MPLPRVDQHVIYTFYFTSIMWSYREERQREENEQRKRDGKEQKTLLGRSLKGKPEKSIHTWMVSLQPMYPERWSSKQRENRTTFGA